MKRQIILSIAFSLFAVNAFAATSRTMIAEGGSDRLIESRVAADGSDHLKANSIAADGSDRLKGNQVAEGGSDRLQQNRVSLNPANAAINGVLVADNRAEFGSKYQRY